MTESSPQLLRHLVEQCLDRWEDGGESVVSVVCADHPELETRVRGRLATLVNMGLLGEPPSRDDVPERLGDFRLERVLGSGGMGVVYLAVQESLGREVALKVVRPDLLLFPGARERFQREVETISRLDHPGIVKVHAFGEEKGIPYFAMELVRGISLADLLGNLHKRGLGSLSSGDITAAVAEHTATKPQPSTPASEDWVRTVFRLVETVARALQHAHEQQILHRDIKPANIMLAADSRPLLLDFSLARTSEASDLTQSGALLGSLPYMAPEQVLGAHDRINATTDVYGLGVTLYELLTLHSPHLGSDVEETRARILEGTPLPVTRLNPRVPWDAETVCLKAIDVDQQQRYPSVAAFADDLRNYLEHKPIAARRPSTGLRIRRAAQRHPAKATALAIGLVVAIGGPILFGFVQQSYAKELGGALRETKAQKVRADGHLADALDAMSHVLGSTGDSRFMRLPFVDELSRKQLETAVAFYHRLEKSEPGDIRVARAMVRTLVRIGSLRAMIGEADAAERDLLAALARSEQLTGGEADDPTIEQRTRAWARLGNIERRRGHVMRSRACFVRARTALRGLVDRHPEQVHLSIQLSETERDIAMTDAKHGRADAAVELCSEVVEREIKAAQNTKNPKILLSLARSQHSLGSALRLSGRNFRVALRPYRAGIATLARAMEVAPKNAELLGERGTQHYNLGAMMFEYNRQAAAEKLMAVAVGAFAKQRELRPSRPHIEADHARALSTLAGIRDFHKTGDSDGPLGQAVAILESLAARFPTVGSWQEDLAHALGRTARRAIAAGDRPAAARLFVRLLPILTKAAATKPPRPGAAYNLGVALLDHGRCLENSGKPGEAIAQLTLARTSLENALAPGRQQPYVVALRAVLLGLARLTAQEQGIATAGIPFLEAAIHTTGATGQDLQLTRTWPVLGDSKELQRLLETAPTDKR